MKEARAQKRMRGRIGKVGTEAERRKSGKKEQDEEGSEGVSLPTVASAG